MAINIKVIICRGISIDRQYTNVLDYNETQMLNLCNSKKVAERNNYSFVGKENTISTDFNYDDVIKCNYLAFQNQRYSNKWFFAWIDKVDYVNDGVTRISFTVDHWSTWFGYWSQRPCFTIREHVADDTIGLHTIDENLDVGRVESILTTKYDFGLSEGSYVIIASNYNPKQNPSWWDKIFHDHQYTGITIYNNLVSGQQLFVIKIDPENIERSYFNVILFLYDCNKDGFIGDVHDMWVLPKSAIDPTLLEDNSFPVELTAGSTFTCENYVLRFSYIPKTGVWNMNKITSFSDLPNIKNNKCYCYPYNYLYVTNNAGNNNIYKYEDFKDEDYAEFITEFAVCLGGSGRLVPKDFKGVEKNYDESIPIGKYPVCSWSADYYTNWLTQNAVNIGSKIFLTGAKVATLAGIVGMGAVTPEELGSSLSENASKGSDNIASTIGEFYKASLLPNIEGGGQNTGDVSYSAGSTAFNCMRMRAKPEYLKIIDDYFTKFGYKVNRLKVPEFGSRLYWNYVQIAKEDTIGIPSIVDNGVIKTTPDNSFEVINNITRKGVTIWHDHDYIGNYGLPNTILN